MVIIAPKLLLMAQPLKYPQSESGPSVTLLDCTQMAEDIVKLLSRSGSPIILVF